MKIIDMIHRDGKGVSFEFFPPRTEEAEGHLFDTISKLERFSPVFVSITYGAGGSTSKTTKRVVERVVHENCLTPMPHLTCVNQSEAEIREILRDYRDMGVENILALRGDHPKGLPEFSAKVSELPLAEELVRLIADSRDFGVSVAVYPEGHVESVSLQQNMEFTKRKIDAGADFGITQMFFENRHFYDFLQRAEKAGISVPIIPGIMPISDIGKIKRFVQSCAATLPEVLVRRMEEAVSSADAEEIGLEYATMQCEDLLKNGVRFLHFYTLNRAEPVTTILRNLGMIESQTRTAEAVA